MEPRHRSNHSLVAGGSVWANGVKQYDETYIEVEDDMDDFTGKHRRKKPIRLLPDSNCDIYRNTRVPPTYTDTGGYFELKQVRPYKDQYARVDEYPWRGSGTRESENAYFINVLLAKTHPFRSEYSVPTSMVELLDLPSMASIVAKSFSGLVGSSYLSYRFGFPQFVQDIKTLSGITKALESRVKEYSSLNRHGGLRRNVKLGENVYRDSGRQTIWSTWGHFVTAEVTSIRKYIVRGSVRWRWKDGADISLSKLEAFNEAVKAIFDIGELDSTTLWNSVPWTWLADYFVDVSSWLQANENHSWVEPYDISIIRRFKSRTEIDNLEYDVGFGIKGHITGSIYSRDSNLNSTLFPAARYSFLTTTQYLTMLALLGKFRGG
ncbi:TPA_asm: maturation protein [ssRNA phage Gerhypos.4_39]|uniref:Maturation protein n=2 Tax=Leviviricetes TaxID=2842243 RepID=A0A8S5L2J5_9VIRU|nr:maturation protein [ssRNA phage Gerhypos.4_39]QDH86652.1 MAG: hypothetical protein H2Bulk35543_000003 [Leviviridae sp.]QDH91140.1 MAG: hypothetical protein H4Bulk46683_000003 [Leviviridae sp.]DAD51623.1 TPA_asm: maturation protein [ssRNA phage Gerhypos.4_39]